MASSPTSLEVVRFAQFETNLRTRELRREGVGVRLPDQSFEVLAMLLEHPGKLVTREEIHKRLWSADTFVDFDHGLNNAVKRLRDALGDSAESPRFVETLPRRGYRFIWTLEGAPQHPEDAGTSVSAPSISSPLAPTRLRAALVSTAVLAAVGFLAFGFSFFGLRWRVLTLRPEIRSIAVLPLENLSGDSTQDYFAEGMTDELITNLAKIQSLQVISRTSSRQFGHSLKPLSEIARALNVDGVVEGSVVLSGGRVRVTAQLIYGPTDRHLWTNEYERELRDIVGLQKEVAQAIAEEVRVKITPIERSRLGGSRSSDPGAYDAYLRGRYFASRVTKADFWKSLEYFQEAIQRDPTYAEAYVGLGESYGQLADLGAVEREDGYLKMKAATAKALEIDDTLAEAHEAMGYYNLYHEWAFAAAEQEFKRAIELNPNYPDAHDGYGECLIVTGRTNEAVAETKKAYELDPLGRESSWQLANTFYLARQYDQAIRQYQRNLESDPLSVRSHYGLGEVYLQTGRLSDAVGKFSAGQGHLPPALLGYAYARAGLRRQAQEVLQQWEEAAGQKQGLAGGVAVLYIGLGRKNEAFYWLEKAYSERSDLMLTLKTDPLLDSLRPDPRFAALLRRMKL